MAMESIHDFGFYYTYGYEFWSKFTNLPDSSTAIYLEELFIKREVDPSPFYSVIAFSLLLIFGNSILFIVQGLVIGLSNIFLIFQLTQKHLKTKANIGLITLFFLLISLNSVFFRCNIGSSVDSVFILLVLLGLNQKRAIYRYLLFSASTLIRSNSIVFIISLLISLILVKPKKWRESIMYSLIPLTTYILAYQFYYSGIQLHFQRF